MPCKRTSYFIWEFLLAILQEDECSSTISWTNESALEFEIKDMKELAKLWGVLRGNPEMDKESFFRALRYYYKINVITKVRLRLTLYQANQREHARAYTDTRFSFENALISLPFHLSVHQLLLFIIIIYNNNIIINYYYCYYYYYYYYYNTLGLITKHILNLKHLLKDSEVNYDRMIAKCMEVAIRASLLLLNTITMNSTTKTYRFANAVKSGSL